MTTTATPYYQKNGVSLYLGDCRDILPLLQEKVHLVLTDPPYEQSFNWAWSVLGESSARLLVSGGSLVTLAGHHQTPEALDALRQHLRFWWIGGMLQAGRQTRMMGKGVVIGFKPALWFVKERRRQDVGGLYPLDMMQASNPLKQRHKWEQPLAWFRHWQDRLTLEGELVLDPFAGSGTTIVGARMSGRRAIGIEQDEVHLQRLVGELETTGRELALPFDVEVAYGDDDGDEAGGPEQAD